MWFLAGGAAVHMASTSGFTHICEENNNILLYTSSRWYQLKGQNPYPVPNISAIPMAIHLLPVPEHQTRPQITSLRTKNAH